MQKRTSFICGLICFILMANAASAQFICETFINAKHSTGEEEFNAFVLEFRDQGGHHNTDILYLPTVVHVIMRSPEDSISIDRVIAQLIHTNKHLRRQNPDTIHTREMFKAVAADTHIELCLATIKPNGEEFDGIVWHLIPDFEMAMTTEVMAATIFDPDKYFNVWARPVPEFAFGVVPWLKTPDYDGIVVAHEMVGLNLGGDDPDIQGGKIFTHEVGHYLGLYHTFHQANHVTGQCESFDCDLVTDRCCDTPIHWSEPFAPGDDCYFNVITCPNDSLIYPQNENYMYYNPDECLNMFSLDQRIRMRAALSGVRAELCSPENLVETGANCDPFTSIKAPDQPHHIKIYPNPAGDHIYIDYGIFYPGNKNTEIRIYDHSGKVIRTKSGVDIRMVSLEGLPQGFYIIQMKVDQTLIRETFVKSH